LPRWFVPDPALALPGKSRDFQERFLIHQDDIYCYVLLHYGDYLSCTGMNRQSQSLCLDNLHGKLCRYIGMQLYADAEGAEPLDRFFEDNLLFVDIDPFVFQLPCDIHRGD
jgi:hypothetical protein